MYRFEFFATVQRYLRTFLRNDAINRLNLHSGIQALAQSAGGAFIIVFLLRAGVSIPASLVALAGIVAGRFIVRPTTLPLAKRWGLRRLLILGTVGRAVQYPLLAEVRGVGGVLLAFCIVSSLAEVLYWVSYHAYFAALGDVEHRGHQIGAREGVVAIVGIIAPLLGGWALVIVGARWTFAAVGLIQTLAAIPLLRAPNVPVRLAAPGAFRSARLAIALNVTDGWFDGCFVLVWEIALFVSLRESFTAYGGAMALAGLVGAFCGLLLGPHVDAGHGRRVVVIAYSAAAIIALMRAASLGSPWLAVSANALGALLTPLLVPATGTAIYNLAKASPCPLRFHMATEAGWDVGCFAACLIAAAISAAGVPLSIPILLALPGTAAGTLLLRRLYPASAPAVMTVLEIADSR